MKDPFGLGMSSLNAPLFVVYSVTKLCNLKCPYCFADASLKHYTDELTTEEALSVIDECYKNKVFWLQFSGGEPLMRKDFFTLLEYAHEKEFPIVIQSNGTLITEEIAHRLRKLGVAFMGVSLDGGIPKTHEESRGVGNFQKTITGINNLLKENIRVKIGYKTTMENLTEIPHVLDHFQSQQHFVGMHLYSLADVGRQSGSNLLSKENSAKVLSYTGSLREKYHITFTYGYGMYTRKVSDEKFIQMLKDGKRENVEFPNCGAGRTQCNIWYNGLVKPCEIWPVKDAVGNIKERGLADLWQNAPLFKQLRSLNIRCKTCPFFDTCGGGCRFESRLVGDPELKNPPPSCLHAEYLGSDYEKIRV